MIGKQATLRDVIVFPALFFGLLLFLLFIHFIAGTIFSELQNVDKIGSNAEAVNALDAGNGLINRLDLVSIMFFIGSLIVFVVTGWFVAGHPALIVVYFVGGMVASVFSALVANFWEDITLTPELLSSLTYFPIANHLMLNLPVYVVIMWFLGLVITFRKPREGGFEI